MRYRLVYMYFVSCLWSDSDFGVILAFARGLFWRLCGPGYNYSFDHSSLYITKWHLFVALLLLFCGLQFILTSPHIYFNMSSSGSTSPTPYTPFPVTPPVPHPIEKSPTGSEPSAMGVEKVADAQECPADTPGSPKNTVDEDGYSADIDVAVIEHMLFISPYATEGRVFKARFDEPELVRQLSLESYSPISPRYSPSSPAYRPELQESPMLLKFTAAVPAVPRPIPATQKRKIELADPGQPLKRARTGLTIEAPSPTQMYPLSDLDYAYLRSTPDIMKNFPLPEPTAEDLDDAYEFLKKCMEVSMSETESETESEDEIFSDSSDSDDIEYHTSDDEVYPDECAQGEYDANMAKFNGELAAFKKDGSYYDPRMGFPLFEGYAPVGHPYPLAFERGVAPEEDRENCAPTAE